MDTMIFSRNSTVLIAGGDESVKSMAFSTFKAKGFDVLSASNAEDALQLWECNRNEITLLFTDVVLSGMSGFDLAREIRVTHPELPVIFSSRDSAEPPDNNVDFHCGVKYLPKPYRPDELSVLISGLLKANALVK